MQAALGLSVGCGHLHYNHGVGLRYCFELYAHLMQQKDSSKSEQYVLKEFSKVNRQEGR